MHTPNHYLMHISLEKNTNGNRNIEQQPLQVGATLPYYAVEYS